MMVYTVWLIAEVISKVFKYCTHSFLLNKGMDSVLDGVSGDDVWVVSSEVIFPGV